MLIRTTFCGSRSSRGALVRHGREANQLKTLGVRIGANPACSRPVERRVATFFQRASNRCSPLCLSRGAIGCGFAPFASFISERTATHAKRTRPSLSRFRATIATGNVIVAWRVFRSQPFVFCALSRNRESAANSVEMHARSDNANCKPGRPPGIHSHTRLASRYM